MTRQEPLNTLEGLPVGVTIIATVVRFGPIITLMVVTAVMVLRGSW